MIAKFATLVRDRELKRCCVLLAILFSLWFLLAVYP